MHEQMYAVQQIYALRYHRFEVNPYFGLTMNDQFVSHNGPGLALNFYITNVVAVGVNGNFYQGLNSPSDFDFETSRAARVGEPINEYQWSASANVTYVPAYGKFAGFGDFIFHYDFFVHAGAGAISTRPIAVIDPDNRSFSFVPKPMGQARRRPAHLLQPLARRRGRGQRLHLREKLENPTIAAGHDAKRADGPDAPGSRRATT